MKGTLLEALDRDVVRLAAHRRRRHGRREALGALALLAHERGRAAARRAAGRDGRLHGAALDGLEVGRGQVADLAVAGAAAPPFRGVAHRVGFGEDGDQVAFLDGEVDAVGLLLRGVVVDHAAEVEFPRVDGRGFGLAGRGVDDELGAVGLLCHQLLLSELLCFLGASEHADQLAH